MKPSDDDIVRVASGNLVQVEMWQVRLKEAGIESRVVGDDLYASVGSMFPAAVELWVHQHDLQRAQEILAMEPDEGEEQEEPAGA
jgi:Putative prokaryotic signal transducing protein